MKANRFNPSFNEGRNFSFALNEHDVETPPMGAACAPGATSNVDRSTVATNPTARSRFIVPPSFLVDLRDRMAARVPRRVRPTHPSAGGIRAHAVRIGLRP